MKILGIAGSLRKGSYNKASLIAAQKEVPKGVSISIFEINDIPLYNQDNESPLPSSVKKLKDKIKNSDAILIATPEYNYSVSGVLKNAIDWGSRPYGKNSWEGKSVAIMSASTGLLGGSRAQYHLRQSLVSLDMKPINRPEVVISSASKKFDSEGHLIDEPTRKRIRQLVLALVDWTNRLQRLSSAA